MVTLHLLQALQNKGYGTIDHDLFWGKLPLSKSGIAIFTRGGTIASGRTSAAQPFELNCRGVNDLEGADRLEIIAWLLSEEWVLCDLPVVPNRSDKLYKNVRITDLSNVDDSLGEDETGRRIYSLSGVIRYNK